MKEKPSRKAGGMQMDNNVFGYFKHLIDDDDEVRVQGTRKLIEFLCHKGTTQRQNGSNGVDGGEKTPSKTTETAYSLKRMIRGLGSMQNASRAGFFTGLVGLLEQLKQRDDDECPTVTELFALVKAELNEREPDGVDDGKQKQRLELRIGKVLVCGAIIKAGLIENASEMELQNVVKTLKNGMYKMVKPLAYTFLNDLVPRLNASRFSKVFWPVFESLLNVPKEEHSMDSVFFLLLLSTGTHRKLVNHKYFDRNFGVPKLLHENNFSYLVDLLFGIDNTMAMNHPFYECLLEQLAKADMLVPFWRDAVLPVLERETANRPKYCDIIVLRMVISVFGRLSNYADVPEILQPTFMKFLVERLKNRNKYSADVQNLYLEACLGLVGCYPKIEDESARLDTFRCLIRVPSTILIEKYASCKMLQSLLVTLSAEGLRTVGNELKQSILDRSTGTNAERTAMIHMLEWLLSLRQLTTDASDKGQPVDEWYLKMIQFFLNVGIFYSADGIEVLKSSKHAEAVPEELATTLRGLFFRSLEHRHPKLSHERDFLLAIVCHIDGTIRAHGGVKSLRNPLTDEQIACWNKMFTTVSSSKKVIKMPKKSSGTEAERNHGQQCDTVFHILLMHMGLHLFNDPDVACSSIMELDSVMKRIDEKAKQRRLSNGNSGSARKKGKKQKPTEEEGTDDEPEWIEVVVDLFLNLLSQNSHLLRKVIGHMFPHLSGEITFGALHQILAVINLKDKQNPLSADDEDENGSEIDEEDTNSAGIDEEDSAQEESGEESADEENDDDDDDDEEQSDEENVKENEEDDDEDDEIMGGEAEEENISDHMRLAVQTALGGANPETDTESLDLDDLDEEQGRRLDVALGAAFRAFRKSKAALKQRQGPSRAKQQMDTVLTHFRMRALDLIDAYLKQEPDMLLCLELMLYIFEMLPVAIRDTAKYGAILNRYKHIFHTLTRIKKFKHDAVDVPLERLREILGDLIKKVAKGVAFPERNQYLLMACQFIVLCSQMLAKHRSETGANEPTVEAAFGELLTEFLTNRNPPLAFNVFQSLFRMQWNGNWHLATRLSTVGLKMGSVRAIRRIQALQLLRELLRNRRLINSDLAQATRLLHTICSDSLTPYVTELETAVVAGDRSIGQNELCELIQVLLEVQSISRQMEAAAKGKKGSELLRWEKVGAQVQTMRTFALNAPTLKCYRQLCQRLKLTPIGNEGLPALKESVATKENVATAEQPVNGVGPKDKKKKKQKKQTTEASNSIVNGNGTTMTINGHDGTNGSSTEDVEMATAGSKGDESAQLDRKRNGEKRKGNIERLAKGEKRLRKEARLMAASHGLDGISFEAFTDVAMDA